MEIGVEFVLGAAIDQPQMIDKTVPRDRRKPRRKAARGVVTGKLAVDREQALLDQIVELVKISGLSISEASATTGQSESLIKVNIHRGIKRLAALVERG